MRNENRERKKVDIPCFCMTERNLTMTLEEGLIKTWRLPAFSALLMALSASLRTEVLTILSDRDSQIGDDWGYEVSERKLC